MAKTLTVTLHTSSMGRVRANDEYYCIVEDVQATISSTTKQEAEVSIWGRPTIIAGLKQYQEEQYGGEFNDTITIERIISTSTAGFVVNVKGRAVKGQSSELERYCVAAYYVYAFLPQLFRTIVNYDPELLDCCVIVNYRQSYTSAAEVNAGKAILKRRRSRELLWACFLWLVTSIVIMAIAAISLSSALPSWLELVFAAAIGAGAIGTFVALRKCILNDRRAAIAIVEASSCRNYYGNPYL